MLYEISTIVTMVFLQADCKTVGQNGRNELLFDKFEWAARIAVNRAIKYNYNRLFNFTNGTTMNHCGGASYKQVTNST